MPGDGKKENSAEDALMATFPLDAEDPLQKIKECFDSLAALKYPAFERQNQRDVVHVSADPAGVMVQEITVSPYYCSDRHVLHGSAASLLLEGVTFCVIVILCRRGFWAVENSKHPGRGHMAAVTRSMSTTYFRPAPVGMRLKLVGRVVHMGPRMALIRGEIWDKEKDELICVCNHEIASLVGNSAAMQKFSKAQKAGAKAEAKL